ncbi:MAG: undecaprenyldiphospho-muramoylpentapeptide beta-N-acetylglucosaminyltransferase [Pseudomonadota bacterium]
MSRVMIMAGGTGGHIMPALAVAEELRSRGVDIVWLGNRDGLEAKLVSRAGIDLEAIRIRGIRKSGILRKLMAPLQIFIATLQSIWAIVKRRPAAVLGMGGFVSGPGGLAGRMLGKPLLLHEQNAVAGITNRMLSKLTRHVLLGFPVSQGLQSAEWVGNPVRKDIASLPVPEQRLSRTGSDFRVLVIGGSQGAEVFNKHLPELLSRKSFHKLDVWHQCGRHESATIGDRYLKYDISCQVNDFIDDMAAAYAWADVVICRAGAMTVSEVCAAGAVAILVPYPYAVGDHQLKNANFLLSRSAALVVEQQEFLLGGWLEDLDRLARDRSRLVKMATAARRLSRPDAARLVADKCLELINA